MVVTANRLGDGAVVYRTADGRWTEKLSEAAVLTTVPSATEVLQAAIADDVGAVGAYVAPVQLNGDQIRPGNQRELIRLQGPTVELPAAFGI